MDTDEDTDEESYDDAMMVSITSSTETSTKNSKNSKSSKNTSGGSNLKQWQQQHAKSLQDSLREDDREGRDVRRWQDVVDASWRMNSHAHACLDVLDAYLPAGNDTGIDIGTGTPPERQQPPLHLQYQRRALPEGWVEDAAWGMVDARVQQAGERGVRVEIREEALAMETEMEKERARARVEAAERDQARREQEQKARLHQQQDQYQDQQKRKKEDEERERKSKEEEEEEEE